MTWVLLGLLQMLLVLLIFVGITISLLITYINLFAKDKLKEIFDIETNED